MTLHLLLGAAALVGASVYFAPKIVGFFKKQATSVKSDVIAPVKADAAAVEAAVKKA